MLQTFPQQPRETLPEGITLQRHLRNLLENLRENPLGRNRAQKDPEFRQAVLTIHDAAHSRPGEELTPGTDGGNQPVPPYDPHEDAHHPGGPRGDRPDPAACRPGDHTLRPDRSAWNRRGKRVGRGW